MKINWSVVKPNHIHQACRKYDSGEDRPTRGAVSTFLIVGEKRYPAKFIRGLAYYLATGERLNPNTDYSGGMETARFFKKLGFTIEYARQRIIAEEPAKKLPEKEEKPAATAGNHAAREPVGSEAESPAGCHTPPGPTREVDADTTRLLASIEYYFQEIRLCYLRWATHPGFFPPGEPVGALEAGDRYRMILSNNGNAFSLSPCGSGSIYAGGEEGSVKMPADCYPCDQELSERTEAAKKELFSLVGSLRNNIRMLMGHNRMAEVWSVLQDYYWIKFGLHEFAFDNDFRSSGHDGSLREIIMHATREAEDLGETWQKYEVAPKDIRALISYQTTWSKYACCSFDCGPIAISREGFVHFSEFARQRSGFETPGDSEPQKAKRAWAKKVLDPLYDLLLCYDEPPLDVNWTYGDWMKIRADIVDLVDQVESRLKKKS